MRSGSSRRAGRSSGDNPLLVPETGRALSNGNFHALALALAFDALRVGIAHVGMVSERRAQKLVALRWGHDVSVDDEIRNGRWQAGNYTAPGLLAYSAAAMSPMGIGFGRPSITKRSPRCGSRTTRGARSRNRGSIRSA